VRNARTKERTEGTKGDTQQTTSHRSGIAQAPGSEVGMSETAAELRLDRLVVLIGMLFAALHYWPPGHG
jgi:hypothetical protein